MKKGKLIIVIIGLLGLIGGGVIYYIFNAPHRNVQTTNTDFRYNASEIVNEYLLDAAKANDKYLDEEGESKVLEITGVIDEITEDFNQQKVILLKSKEDKAGVSCTFINEASTSIESLQLGEKISVKGVIRSGAAFDADMNLYENVIMEKCSIINN